MEEVNYLERPVVLTDTQIEAVLLHLGASRTKMQGNNVQADHCFLHHNSSPTLGVSLDAPHAWSCFSCRAKGPDIIALVQKARKLQTRKEAYGYVVEHFAPELAGPTKFSLRRRLDLSEPPPRFVLPETSRAAYPLDVENRIGYRACRYYLGITDQQADEFQLGYRLKDHRLVFPLRHADGALAGLVGRCMLPNCPKGNRWRNFDQGSFRKEFVLLGHHIPANPTLPLLVVEGPKDYFRIRSFGYTNVRATLGTSCSQWQQEELVGLGCDTCILYDQDAPGIAASNDLRKRLTGHLRLLSHKFPKSCIGKDGKGDPGMLDKKSFDELLASLKPGFNFTRM